MNACVSLPAVHPGGGAAPRAAPGPGPVLHQEDARLLGPRQRARSPGLHRLLLRPLRGERPVMLSSVTMGPIRTQ